jgi:hypothetical protein
MADCRIGRRHVVKAVQRFNVLVERTAHYQPHY